MYQQYLEHLKFLPFWTLWTLDDAMYTLFKSSFFPEQICRMSDWYNDQRSNEQPVCEVPEETFCMDISEYSIAKVRAMSEGFSRPVVIRGLFRDSKAVRNWSPESLKERIGDEVVTVADLSYDYEEIKDMKFASFIDGEETLYIKFLPNLFYKHPELIDELEFEEVLQTWRYKEKSNYTPFVAEFFIGHGLNPVTRFRGTPIHCAPHHNVFVQIYGTKTWTLINPKYSAYLRPLLMENYGVAAISPIDDWKSPRYSWIPRYQVTLQPGDALFNPSWFWHMVENHGFSIGVASRDEAPMLNFVQNPLFTLCRPLFLVSTQKRLNERVTQKLARYAPYLKKVEEKYRKQNTKDSSFRERLTRMKQVSVKVD